MDLLLVAHMVLPEFVFDKLFCPSVETDKNTGEVKVAQCGLRRIESALLKGIPKRRHCNCTSRDAEKIHRAKHHGGWNKCYGPIGYGTSNDNYVT